jgi:hypothetical protein
MGNRHRHKKQRLEIRARMARTGESYQQALAKILHERAVPIADVDLVGIDYFGEPAALATFQILGRVACLLVSSRLHPRPFPDSPFFALATRGPRTVH